MVVEEEGGVGAAVAVVDADVGGGGGGEDLRLVFQARVGLDDGKREIASHVRFEVHLPKKRVSNICTAQTQRPKTSLQHVLFSFFNHHQQQQEKKYKKKMRRWD